MCMADQRQENLRPDLESKIDTSRKHSARVWNYWLGGKDNYPVDRAAGDEYAALYPEIIDIARDDRQFLRRCVTYLAGEVGIRQFLDIGTGLPTVQSTHEIAQSIAPESKIVYVDNDPLVLAHARALLTNTTPEGVTTYIDADVREPELIISDARNVLNFNLPIAVLLMGILGHAAPTADQMRSILDRLMAAVPSGSYLAITDGVDIGHQGYREASALHAYHLRTRDEFLACFEGLEVLDPGLVVINMWRPDDVDFGNNQPRHGAHAIVGRKP
jgi:S-adenosyl methyltransferase